MPTKKYYCCICGKQIPRDHNRLTHQKYGIGRYQQFTPVKNFDFCEKHFKHSNKINQLYNIIKLKVWF